MTKPTITTKTSSPPEQDSSLIKSADINMIVDTIQNAGYTIDTEALMVDGVMIVSNALVLDNVTADKSIVGLTNVTNDAQVKITDLASQAEAEAGSNNTKWMTPLRTSQAITALGGGGGSGLYEHIGTLSWSAETTEKSITAISANYHTLMVSIGIRKAAGTSGGFGMRINDITASSYKFNNTNYATVNNTTTTYFRFRDASTGAETTAGVLHIYPKATNNDIMISGGIFSSDVQSFMGGRVTTSGDVTKLSFSDYDASAELTGTVEVWGMKKA